MLPLISATQSDCLPTGLRRLSRGSNLRRVLVIAVLAVLVVQPHPVRAEKSSPPNIVLILADDLGYGDLGCYNPQSRIATPNLDRLAREGRRFTDAHAPGSVCVPTRYGLLTGRYPFRADLPWRRRSVIDADTPTLASWLVEAGYTTACVGKWHLGFDGGPDYDYGAPLLGGPRDRGFDFYFGLPHSLDIPPYYYVRDRRAVAPPTVAVPANSSEGWSPIQGRFWREGLQAPGFEHADVLPRLQQSAVDWLEQYGQSQKEKPFFLYVALPSPHTPWLPDDRFLGKSRAGLYGDFVMHTDAVVGALLDQLRQQNLDDDTLVIFTSDNGPVWYPEDAERFGHRSTGPLRGMKGDAWEGGHRVPFIARWSGRTPAGTTSDALLCQTDLFRTFAAILDRELPGHAAPDSVSILRHLVDGDQGSSEQESQPAREIVTLSSRGMLAFRRGPWKLIPGLGSGGFSKPSKRKPEGDEPAGQLYRLDQDPGEQTNLWNQHPEIVREMKEALRSIRDDS